MDWEGEGRRERVGGDGGFLDSGRNGDGLDKSISVSSLLQVLASISRGLFML